MNFLSALYRSYDSAEKAGLVDKQDGNATILLPLYHTSLNSNGKNIIKVTLNEMGEFYKAEILDKEAQIIFPITEDSVSRTGTKPKAHPLSDKLSYFMTEETVKHADYLNQFDHFMGSLDKSSDCYRFMRMIESFINHEAMFSLIVDSLYEGNEYQIEGSQINFISDKKKSVVNLADYFLTFEILNFKDKRNYNVTNYVALHQAYIHYIESKVEAKGMCCISGQSQVITTKHRGVLGNAKVISVSNNKETYYGRFKEKTDIISVGYQTSEKAHLMLKYLLENKNSCRELGTKQYLINWFSYDIKNEQEFDITQNRRPTFFRQNTKKIATPVTSENKDIGNVFAYGWTSIDSKSRYYIGIIDDSSKGRSSVKYFRDLPTSELIRNINLWEEKYQWYFYDNNSNSFGQQTPSFSQIIHATFGIERDGQLIISDKKDQKNLKNLFVKMIGYLIDGARIPKSISKQLAVNIRQRHRYDKTWKNLVFVAQGILNSERQGGYNYMLDKGITNRSYLYGRLLAIYDLIEQATFIREDGKGENERMTNAQTYWTAYNRTPATTMRLLENKVKPYEKKLKISKPGLFYKLKKEKEEIINILHDIAYLENSADKSLDFDFIFGYQAEINFVYTKKEKEETQND